MKRKLLQRRLLSCFLAVAVLLGCILSCLPVRAGAIVPLGLVQSALASYVTSTGYKMYNDQGTGQDILASLSDLYQTWLDSPAGVTASQWTLAHIAAIEAVYTDTSGQIVIQKAAADVFQQFADWIQTEHSVPVGSDVPTEVVPSSGDLFFYQNISIQRFSTSNPLTLSDGSLVYSSSPCGTYSGHPIYFVTTSPGQFFVYVNPDQSGSLTWVHPASYSSLTFNLVRSSNGTSYSLVSSRSQQLTSSFASSSYVVPDTLIFDGSFVNSYSQLATAGNFSLSDLIDAGGGVVGLGVTLAQAVADIIGQAKDDDAVVIGVGASAGATAQDIADLVAQGIKAQTLEPSVSITAEAVIDTPVQPYPDVEDLGLPTLGAALVSRFPFCVPWDFVDTLKILNADPVPPVFDVTLVPASVAARWGVSGNYTIHVDLTSQEYAKLFVALRWGTLVGFCLGLALLTKRLIWTA